MALSDHLDDRLGAGEDLLRGVDTREMAVIAVVSADQQHDHLRRLGEVEFAVLQVPQDFLGPLGIHRMYIGKIGTGILWLLTGSLCGIGWLYDFCTFNGQIDERNYNSRLRRF